ncbi:MAG: zinc metallopeptidase [Planctomycetota bacterium]|jgi:Zn-dependent membrane protease YugP
MLLMFNPLFWIMVGPAFLIALWAQYRVKSTFAKYSRVPSRSGMSGARAAQAIIRAEGLDVTIEPVPGELTDHYDPRSKTLRLSEPVYGGTSLAALGIAAHEAGHAIQHARRYAPMAIRSAIVPVASLGSNLAMPLFIVGLILMRFGPALGQTLMSIAIIAFAVAVVFQIVTLPVEFNASKRAVALLTTQGIVTDDEAMGAKRVLSAAALTYVAAALQMVMTLLYLILRSRR